MSIVIMGVFNADTTYRAARMPRMGETILGESFALTPGGKGSNQAVAAARAGGQVQMLTRLGRDAFGDLARRTWEDAGVIPRVIEDPDNHTGAAFIFVDAGTGDNAIIVAPGAAGGLSPEDVEANRSLIEEADIFLTQLEQPLDAAHAGLRIARSAGTRTILNPAPATEIPGDMLALCDFITPNESEAEALTGIDVSSIEGAERAARDLVARGVGAVILTLGENGALFHDGIDAIHVPALHAGPVAETTGAGDAFNGGVAAALSRGADPKDAVRFGNATAAISVTRAGAAMSMPLRTEIEALLRSK
ncbi:ribokinase [Palleronia sp. LCG004]|uniref:ribokinase n=1 Tax=Palleronia sp. LCG004 TaxID=3079304 RepID=UPI002941BDF7|nr:ribokinase [Palleronia sp. LCG004]WOI55726.1 ribokinase [Palleronia sp. LCG004]